ncbi:hypothetical protein NLJ89_g1724 [Agrocybe chaxingu]|uniref:Sodium/calcium exchanger membrane region domain-containing protein n=1 Tax=Agrocybe chaxingu TaxID=84603 RepID=A0A9W8TCZ1_9AGAR|nr:hypothetical protein NLJ89_g1724 [Agrocybe chaxingu]
MRGVRPVSFLAIIPLAKLLGFATEELSLRVGQTLAGLLNATLGNAVELIVAIIALVKCELRVVQASLVGSILSNLLFVLGMCFFAGGLRYSEQGFGVSATQLNASLMTISVIAVLLPAAFHFTADPTLTNEQEAHDILAVSHGVAIILLFIYAGYLAFQLYSHTALYDDHGIHTNKTTVYDSPKFYIPKFRRRNMDTEAAPITTIPSRTTSNTTLPPINAPILEEGRQKEEVEEVETPQMSVAMTIGLLVAITVLVAITAEWLVDSIDGLTDTGHISKEFVGIILLPIVGNAAGEFRLPFVLFYGFAAQSVFATSGSCSGFQHCEQYISWPPSQTQFICATQQIALFVIPFIVTLGWILGKPLTLLFDPYESISLFLSVLIVNYVVQDGKSNWLEGFILMCLYVILGVTFWFYPGSDPSGVLASCH